MSLLAAATDQSTLLQAGGGVVPRGSRVEVFQQIYQVFLWLGTLVGVVVISYMLWKAYKYRAGSDNAPDDVERPQLGELPSGSGGGRKLFLSFGMSAIIVISLIAWTYGTLLYVESSPTPESEVGPGDEQLTVTVVGYQFGWDFVYPNGHESDVLRVPADTTIRLQVTSEDVFHNFGIPAFRVKSDAIPGETTDTWFIAEETGTYEAQCYELCGVGHSYMNAEVEVMEPSAFQDWYAGTNESDGANNSTDTADLRPRPAEVGA